MPVLEHRNILFCLFDSLSFADDGLSTAMCNLPTLLKLRANSALFTRTYTPCPESSPARASMFTGLDPCVHGLWSNGVALPDSEQTFTQRLAQAGYSNYLAGRYQLSGVSRWTTEKMRAGEFAQVGWAHGPMHRSRQNGYLCWLQEVAPEHYSRLFATQADPDHTAVTQQQRTALEELPDELSFNRWVGKRIGQWIDSHSTEKPFLAIAGFSIGDTLGAEPHPESDGEGVSLRALQQADAAIGQILEQLEASHRADDTVVIMTAARGNSATAEHGGAMKETSIRVPLLIYSARHKHKIIETPISTIDIAPTILELANAPINSRMQGRSLLGVIGGSDNARGWAMSRLRRNSATGLPRWQTALCTNTMKLVVQHTSLTAVGESLSLYNLDTDPQELKNLAGLKAHANDLENMIDQMIDARCALEDRTEPRVAEF